MPYQVLAFFAAVTAVAAAGPTVTNKVRGREALPAPVAIHNPTLDSG